MGLSPSPGGIRKGSEKNVVGKTKAAYIRGCVV